MADRKFHKKKRDIVRRQKKPVMIITAEGKNKTETLYFNSFREQHGRYTIRVVKTGHDTDPAGMLKSMETYWVNNDLSEEDGDKAYIVLDMDCNSDKIRLVRELQRKSKNIHFIRSNPCIEVWFILHYTYSTHQFKDSKEPKKELAKYIPGYRENVDVSEIIRPYMQSAKKNVEQLMEHYKRIGSIWGNGDCNPMTEVMEILLELGVL